MQEALDEEARPPYEALGRRQNEAHFGVSHVLREGAAAGEARTETVIAFLGLSRGFTPRLELGVLLPYVLISEQVDASGPQSRSGIADPVLRARYALRGGRGALAASVGLLATPDWGGRARAFRGQADTLEPFVVLGKAIGAGSAYFRYGYAWRSGEARDAHRFTLGGRRPVAGSIGVLGHVTYARAPSAGERGGFGVTLGGYGTLANGMQLLAWYGRSGFDAQGAGALAGIDDARTRQIALSLVNRF